MNKKIVIAFLILTVMAVGAWWLLQKDNPRISLRSNDPELDSLFFNLHFGMTRQAFFDTCWKLNKQGLVIQGSNNLSVQHEIESELGMPVYMNFYPTFSDDRLYQMPVVYNYQSWAPWNRQLYADSLILRVAKKLEKDFDVKFTKNNTSDGRPAYYNYTGPRKILITTQDEQFVKVLIENEKYK